MGNRDPRVDAYIAKSADFAKPILNHIRTVVHEACPPVEETIKWSMPHFDYGGILCSMAAFKEHCAFHLWHGSLIVENGTREAMGQFGRITKVSDLPPKKAMIGYIKAGMKLRDEGVTSPTRSKAKKKSVEVVVPVELTTALKKNKKALAAFENFPPSHKREYAEWISEAKREETRKKRVDNAVEWITEGKGRNWKYEKR